MFKSMIALLLFLGLLAGTNAEIECQSSSCETALSDDISLIQGMLQADLVTKNVKTDQAETTTTAGTTTQSAAVEGTEVKLNAAGDLAAFLNGIMLNVGMTFFFVGAFLFLQRSYPLMYARRWIDQDAKKFNKEIIEEEQGYFAWMGKAVGTPLLIEEGENSVEELSGLDAAMLMKFTNLALELSFTIGLVAAVCGIPVYAFAGGGMAGEDSLSWAGIGNVVYDNEFLTGKPMDPKLKEKVDSTQWIFWGVAGSVWVVILYVQWRLSSYQRQFVRARLKWLERMPAPRSSTVLVQGIPNKHHAGENYFNTDDRLKKFFEALFGEGTVKEAFVIKHTGNLNPLIRGYDALKAEIAKLEENTEENKEAIELKKNELSEKKKEIEAEQKLVMSGEEYLTTNGFVTFKDRKNAEKALGVRLSESDDEWVLETPPAVTDVRYGDFEYSDSVATTSQLIGYGATAAMFLCFMPIVIGINHISYALEEIGPVLSFLESTGMKETVDGYLPTMGLTVMMSMLPTFLVWIFQAFYTLKADRWAQIQIQVYYYWLLVLFVLLTTSVGSNLTATLNALAQSPFELFTLLAEQMPITTHFYLNYVVLQPVTHAMNLTRYIGLIKFFIFRRSTETEEEAADLSEPEDQDYYGIGSRSARFALMLMIGLVFGTICPLMNWVTLFNFICCRYIYGYLIPFQEQRKDDMGGVHWCIQMHHVQQGLLIYLIMMTGILAERANSKGPCIISAISFLWWAIAYRVFCRSMQWEKLPYASMFDFQSGKERESFQKQRADNAKYEQPQLIWPNN